MNESFEWMNDTFQLGNMLGFVFYFLPVKVFIVVYLYNTKNTFQPISNHLRRYVTGEIALIGTSVSIHGPGHPKINSIKPNI